MAEQKTQPEPGHQGEKPETLERPVEAFEEELADSVHPHGALDPTLLADHFDIRVITPDDIPGLRRSTVTSS